MTSPGFPARQVLIGVLVPVLFLLLLAVLARRSWRYEKVRPPFHGETAPPPGRSPRRRCAAGWPTPSSGTARAASGRSPRCTWPRRPGSWPWCWGSTAKLLTSSGTAHWIALWWIAVGAGGVAMAGAVALPRLDALGADRMLRRFPVCLLIVGAAGLVSAGVFAWLQPSGAAASFGRAARDGGRSRLDRAGHRGGAGPGLGLHAARSARWPGHADRRSVGHADDGLRPAQRRPARRRDLGGAPGRPGDQDAADVAGPRDLRAVPDHLGGPAGGVGGGGRGRGVRAGRTGPVVAGASAARGDARRLLRSGPGVRERAARRAGRSGTNRGSSRIRSGSGRWPGRSSWPGCRWMRAGCCGA